MADYTHYPPEAPEPQTRFVRVPAARLIGELMAIGAAIQQKGGGYVEARSNSEIVYDFEPPERGTVVRVYTSLAQHASHVRECGQDAVRIVVGYRPDQTGKPAKQKHPFLPLADSRKLLRTAPQGPENERIAAFLERLRAAVREAYAAALRIPRCPSCSSPMKERSGTYGAFYGCTRYPGCRGTRRIEGGACG